MAKKKPSTKKLTFSRYIWFINRAQKGKFPNAHSLADEFEISQVQAQRDIEFMRERLGAPLEYQPADKGYLLTDHSFCLPSVWIEEDELLLLAIAKELIRDRDASTHLSSLFNKILPVNSKGDIEAISRLISFKGTGSYRHPAGVLSRLIPVLLEGQGARILYCPVFGDSLEPVELPVIPRHLLFYRTNWYLLAQYKDKLRTYSLSRIRDVIPGEKTTEPFDSQALMEQIEHTYGIFVTDEANPVMEIRLRFSAAMTHYIETISFHPDQSSQHLDDGGLELRFPSTINRELISEVLRYIDEVEIVAPESLKSEVRKVLEKGMRNLA